MNFEIFKNELLNYNAYRRSLHNLQEEADSIIYQYGGVKGVSFDRIPGSSLPKDSVLLEMSEKLEDIERAIDHTQIKIQDIERNLAKLPEDIREMCILLYVKRYPLRYVGELNGYSHTGLRMKIVRAIERI